MLTLATVCIAWSIPHGRPRGIYTNHLLNYLLAKKARIWLEHPIKIKDSLGMIRGKNDRGGGPQNRCP